MEAAGEEKVLLQMRNLTMKLTRRASASVLSLLGGTIWGTPGGMRYQHLNTQEKLPQLQGAWFLTLDKDGEAIGVLCLDQRRVGALDAFYIRYFSFAESMRRKGVEAHAEAEAQASKGQGMFKRFSSSFFAAPTPLLEAAGTPKAVFFAFVELENARSRDMVAQMGLSRCGQFNTRIFSRLFPRTSKRVRRARPDEREDLRARVAAAYADHAFYNDHGLFRQDDFWVLEVDGRVVAGCQAHRVRWRVMEIPGRSGRLLMKTLPYIPLLSRLLNPRKFDFSAIEGLFCEPGHEHLLNELLEAVLRAQGNYTALLWLSTNSPISDLVARHLRFGLLHRLQRDVSATVVMRAYGLTPEEEDALRDRPVYISAFDAT